MQFLRRSALSPIRTPETQPPPQDIGDNIDFLEIGHPDFSPFEFISSQTEKLDTSARHWRDASKTIRELKDPAIGEAISETIYSAFCRDSKVNMQHGVVQDSIRNNSERIVGQLPAYVVMSARYHADLARSTDPKPAERFRMDVFQFHDPLLGGVPEMPSFPLDALSSIYDRLSDQMASADSIGANVVGDLVESVQSPDDLINLSELYGAGIDHEPAFAELRAIIRTDWLKPRRDQSILKAYVDSLREQPEVFVEDFTRAILEPGSNKLRQSVLNMAKFAIIAQGDESENGEAIRKLLANTQPMWGEVEGINEAFRLFSDEQLTALEKAISFMANGFTGRDIRIPPTSNAISSLKKQIKIIVELPSRAGKRAQRRINDRNARTGTDVEHIAQQIEASPTPKSGGNVSDSEPRLDLPSGLSTKQILAALTRLGFETIPGAGKGSHKKIRNMDTGKRTTVGENLGPIPLRSLLGQAGVSDQEFLDNL